jgi:hypothetical protein
MGGRACCACGARWLPGSTEDLADGNEAARIEGQADVAQLVEQLIRNQ